MVLRGDFGSSIASCTGGVHVKTREKASEDRLRGGEIGATVYHISCSLPQKTEIRLHEAIDLRLGVPGGCPDRVEIVAESVELDAAHLSCSSISISGECSAEHCTNTYALVEFLGGPERGSKDPRLCHQMIDRLLALARKARGKRIPPLHFGSRS